MSRTTFTHQSASRDKHTYDIMGDLKVHVTVTENPFDLPLDALFSMAARINKKRAFLFVSKVLGKHLAVDPYVSLLSGSALAVLLQRELNGPAPATELIIEGLRDRSQAKRAYLQQQANRLVPPRPLAFIGFAETATALGHSMYDAFAEGCRYVHTTRELIPELTSSISFEEEHSHATAHRCYAEHPVQAGESIVLVDDEMTTGKTALNIIRELHQKYPQADYYVASLLDWRTAQDQARFDELASELDISIKTLSLIKGEMVAEGGPILEAPRAKQSESLVKAQVEQIDLHGLFDVVPVSSLDAAGERNLAPYIGCTGRFAIESSANAEVDSRITAAAERLRSMRTGSKTLCLGTGEFMYLPMRIAAEMGEGVAYHSTTRSPIHPHQEPPYAIWESHAYPSPEDPTIRHFLYNVTSHQYDDLFVFLERQVKPERLAPFVELLGNLGIERVRLVFVS